MHMLRVHAMCRRSVAKLCVSQCVTGRQRANIWGLFTALGAIGRYLRLTAVHRHMEVLRLRLLERGDLVLEPHAECDQGLAMGSLMVAKVD